MKLLSAAFFAVAAPALFAETTVSEVTLNQPYGAREVSITYKLTGDPAIITINILTNGASIGDAHLTTLVGDVNRLVAPSEGGADRKALWYPVIDWPGHRSVQMTAKVTAWATNAPPDYMVANLIDGSRAYYTSEAALPLGGLKNENNIYRTEKIVFRKIPAKGVVWRMGSPADELGRAAGDVEKPHLVTLTKDYYFAVFPVTMQQHKYAVGDNSPYAPANCFFTNIASHATRPYMGAGMKSVRGTTYAWPVGGHQVDATSHIGRFRSKLGGLDVDLPTEAQWEYAARAGVGTSLTTGKNIVTGQTDPQLDELGRYDRNCGVGDSDKADSPIREVDDTTGTSKVGDSAFLPNNWGIYDIHGNVADLCLDRYAVFSGDMETVTTDPVGDETSDSFVARGGFWGWIQPQSAAACRLAARRSVASNVDKVTGFRHFGYRFCVEIK